jgi:hypothetical protein
MIITNAINNNKDCYAGEPGCAVECDMALGDVNGDGGWNVSDVVILANCILADDCSTIAYPCAADLSNSLGGGVNVQDIVLLVNCILSGNCGEMYNFDPSLDIESAYRPPSGMATDYHGVIMRRLQSVGSDLNLIMMILEAISYGYNPRTQGSGRKVRRARTLTSNRSRRIRRR